MFNTGKPNPYTSQIYFSRHEQRFEIETGCERKQKKHCDLIGNLDLEPLFPGHCSKFGKCLSISIPKNAVIFASVYLRPVLKPENIPSSSQAKQISVYASFVSTLQIRLLLSPFPIVSVAVWITLFARCLNLFQSITKHWSKIILYLKLFNCCLFWNP